MSDPTNEEVFYASFGEFKNGYDRDEAVAGMREAFRRRQRERREQYVEERILGTGLGGPAEGTVRAAIYEPQTVLRRLGAETNAAKEEVEKEKEENGAGDGYNVPRRVMQRYGGVEAEVRSLAEVHAQLQSNLHVAEDSIAHGCSPFTFDELIGTLEAALRIAEEGDASRVEKLPTRAEALHGAEAVMKYVHENILTVVSNLVTVLYATAWMLQYTMTFVDALIPANMEEAQMRLELLAHCVRWLGKIDQFISLSLAVELQWNEYNAFSRMRVSTELHIGELIDGIDASLQDVMQSTQFPRRRQRLLEVESGIKIRLSRLIALLNEIDCGFSPQIRLQVEWKDKFLTRMFGRVYNNIASVFFSASLGFIDETLYVMTSGGQCLPSAERRKSSTSTDNRSLASKEGVSAYAATPVLTAAQVQYHRVEEGHTFQRVAIIVRGVTSCVVGLQLCMGARYVLGQCGPAYDEKWRFSMNEKPDLWSVEEDASVAVTEFKNNVTKRVRRRLGKIPEGKCLPLFT